jgi:ZIP family zinc transporter
VGSIIAFFAKKTNKRFLAISLGFSAGVMIYVSLVEIFVKAKDSLSAALGDKPGAWVTVLAFFGGIFIIALIDRLIPEDENPHEMKNVIADNADVVKKERLICMGLFTALAMAIHNFPEGMATFVSAYTEPTIAIPIVAAIAIHNIPEGIAVSVPIYQATGSKKKAFLYSFLSGLAEPVGALIGFLILLPIMNDAIFGIIFAAVAGIMVFISVDELLPSAREYGEHHLSIYGLIAGMAVMAVSLLLFM